MGPWVRGAATVATSLGLGGCLVINGAFQASGDSEASGGPVVTGTDTSAGTSGDASTASPTTGETTFAETTVGETTVGETTVGETTVGETTVGASGSSGESSGDESSSTGADLCGGTAEDLCALQAIAGKNYLVCERLSTWEEARLACEARCAQLVILDEAESAEIFAALRLQMTMEDTQQDQDGGDQTMMPRASWWIGGRKVNGAYLWLDGAPMPAKGTGGWADSDPDLEGDDGCAVLGVFAKFEKNGKWFDRGCSAVPYRFVCERG